MALASEIINAINTEKGTKAYDTTAQVVRIDGGTAWVHIAGGVDETPVSLTVNCNVGDTVQIRVSGGRAFIVGNHSAPPTDDATAVEAQNTAVYASKTAEGAKETAEAVEGIAVEANETAQQADTKADSALSQVGQSITTDTLHYLATDQGSGVTIQTQGWTTTIQTITETDKYLWIYHTYHKASGQSINTDPVIAGVYGDQGDKGDKGDTGSTGAQGVSVSAVQSQYYLSTSSSSATGGSWGNTVVYEAGKYIWSRDQITYSDSSVGYSTEVYNEALTTACATAESALTIAEGVDEHFWYDNTGAHVTQVTQDEWNDSTDPNYHSGGNTLITSAGMAVRDGMRELATFGASGQTFNNEKSAPIFEVRKLPTSTYANKANYTEYNNESPFVFDLPWGCVSVGSLAYYDSTFTWIQGISPAYTLTGDSIQFDSTACAILQNNNVKYIKANYTASGSFPYYTVGSDGLGDVGKYSLRVGENNVASGITSFASGESTTASGGNSHTEGYRTIASGLSSHAEGERTEATGDLAHAEGYYTDATGMWSHAEGNASKATGQASHASNLNTIADQEAQTAVGSYNTANNVNNLFVVGNGNYNARSDAFQVNKSGDVKASGTITDGTGNVLSNKADNVGLFKIVDLSWTEPLINAHDHGTNTTHTVPSADRPNGMALVGIVGWSCGNYRIYPYVFSVNGDHSISVTMANATTANSASATVHAKLLYIKATSA